MEQLGVIRQMMNRLLTFVGDLKKRKEVVYQGGKRRLIQFNLRCIIHVTIVI